MPDPLLGARDTLMSKTNVILTFVDSKSGGGEE